MIVVPVPEIRIIMRIYSHLPRTRTLTGASQFNNIGIDTYRHSSNHSPTSRNRASLRGKSRPDHRGPFTPETGESRAVAAADIVERLVEFPVLPSYKRYRPAASASAAAARPRRGVRAVPPPAPRAASATARRYARLEEGNVSQRGEAHPCRKTHPQVTARTLRKEQQHAEGHQTAAHHEVDARFGQAVFVRAAHHADPETASARAATQG